jgi:hypothetical protein
VLTVPGDRLVPQDAVEQVQEFGEPVNPRPGCEWRPAEDVVVVPGDTARADTEVQPAAGDVVEGGDLAREMGGMAEVRRGDHGAQADPGCGQGGSGEGGHGVEPWPVDEIAPADVVIGPGVREAVRLGALPPPRGERPPLVRKDHDACPHGTGGYADTMGGNPVPGC